MKDPAGGKAPAGGFKDLGWYGGYQYLGGSFAPKAGQIHPNSPQQGAGQAVSPEVNRQSSIAAGKAPDAFQQHVDKQNQSMSSLSSNNFGFGSGTPGGGAGSGAGVGYVAPEVLNLPKLYDNMYNSSGISDIEQDLLQKERDYIAVQTQIDDNPWLSEGKRVGRQDKLTTDYEKRVGNRRNELAMKKADIQTRLDLETKQFDINSQASQQSLNQFNTLLQMGALDGASGEDIANITRSTGLSSQAIMSAIDNNKKKNMQTSIIQYDDGESQGFAVVDQNGNIINRQIIAGSKPTKGSGSAKEDKLTKDEELKLNYDSLKQSIKSGTTLKSLAGYFGDVLPIEEIYRLYNVGSPNGKAKESIKSVKEGKFKY